MLERPNAQKKYRNRQANKNLVRFELQVRQETKARFDAMVNTISEEYEHPWAKRQRLARARMDLFDKMTQSHLHEFRALQSQIAQLQSEVKALSPTFFTSNTDTNIQLPEAIQALPENPKQLKQILTRQFQETQRAKRAQQKHKESSTRYQKLYEAVNNYNEELQIKLKELTNMN